MRLIKDGARKLVKNPIGKYLELGCGSGNPTLEIARRLKAAGDVVGLDSSTDAIELAQKKASAEKLGNITFVLGDMGKALPFADESFDGILANNSFYLVSDPQKTLIEVIRLLKPGGSFLMTNPKEAASSSAIFREHLAIMKERYFYRYGAVIGGVALAGHTARALYNYSLLLPFQLVLKYSYKIESHFWPAEKWEQVIEEARRASPYPFAVRGPFDAYAGQNHTYIIDRLPR
ncbi:MAG: class I SAM-dependent methyltransferase [Candidatus Margulisiibacteriota bacterium]